MHIPNKFDRNSRERDVYQTLNLKSNILSPSERKEKTNNREEERAVRAGQNFMNRICLDKVLFIFLCINIFKKKKENKTHRYSGRVHLEISEFAWIAFGRA